MSLGRLRLKGQLYWLGKRRRRKFMKQLKRIINRQERHRAHVDPECQPQYNRKEGYAD